MAENQKKRIAFVVNPTSGTQGKEQVLKTVEARLDHTTYTPEIIYTQRAGHAKEIAAQKAAEGYFAVVAVGGDGTVNEIASSLAHTDTALGIIPCGSGNGLARHLQISTAARKAIDTLNGAYTEVIDMGVINRQPFFCTCGVGFDAFVSLKFAKAGRRGPLTYIEQTLIQSLSYKPETYELDVDGATEHYQAFLIAVGNASQYGNNAYITPRATLNDGLLDVTLLKPFTVLDVPSLAFQLFNKTIDQNSHIRTFRCRSLHIHRSTEGVAHFDGDPIMLGTDIGISIEPQCLNVIVPRPQSRHAQNVLQQAQGMINNGLKQISESLFEGQHTTTNHSETHPEE